MVGTLVIASDIRFFGKIYPNRAFILLSSKYTTNTGPYHLHTFIQISPQRYQWQGTQCIAGGHGIDALLTGCTEAKIQEHVGLTHKFCYVKSARILRFYIKKDSLTGCIFLKFKIHKGKSVYIMKYHLNM